MTFAGTLSHPVVSTHTHTNLFSKKHDLNLSQNFLLALNSVLRRGFNEETVNSSATGNFVASIDDAIDVAMMQNCTDGQKLIERQKRIIAARRALGEAHSLSHFLLRTYACFLCI